MENNDSSDNNYEGIAFHSQLVLSDILIFI